MKKLIILFLSGIIFPYTSIGQCDIKMTDIFTPIGNPVVTFHTCESSKPVRDYWDKEIARDWPYAKQIKTYDGYSSTRTFNCHGYAWLRVEQGIDRWIGTGWYHLGDIVDPENIYMTDNSYTLMSQETYPGKVSWASGDHSAITTIQQGVFISKWNEWPLVQHAWNYSPFGTSNLKYYARPYISGPGSCFIGNTVNFTVYNPPASYTWTYSSNLSPGSASGDTKSFTTNNYGYAWVAINLGSTQVAKYDFYIYNYAPNISYIDGPDYVFYNPGGGSSPSTDENYTVVLSNTVAPPYSYSWGMEGDPSYYSLSQNGNTVTVSFKIDFDWSFKLYVDVYNSNGWDQKAKYITFKGSQKSGSGPKVYPNPVSDILNVEIDQAMIDKVKTLQQNSGKSFNADPVFDIRFYNGQNVLLRKQFTKGGTVQFNVSGLPDGIYYLHIYDGMSAKPEMASVIVKHL